jgi:hypothetical protein
MFYLKTGTYLYYVVLNGETHLVGTGSYPEDDPADTSPYLTALNRDFLYMPNWEAVGAMTLLEFREDNNTARYYTPADVFYVFKKKMRSDAWQEARSRYQNTSFEYNEMPEGDFPEITRTFTFSRDASGRWVEENVPTQRAMYSSVKEDAMTFAQEILKLADMLPEACGEGGCTCGETCKCGGDVDCGCGTKTASWYDEESTDSNWYEDGSREAGDLIAEDDDEIVDALRKKTLKSRPGDYKSRRKRLRQDPAARRRRNLQQRKRRRKPNYQQQQKRYLQRTKNSPRSRRRSPRKF